MPEPSGWTEDPTQPPHLVLTSGLGTLRPEAIRPTTANGRELLIVTGADDESLPVRVLELDSGVPLPDRSLLHSAELAALGPGVGRTLLATVTREGTVAVRDAQTGVPAGPALHGPRAPRATAVFVAGGRELVAVSGADQCRVWDATDGSPVAERDFGGGALVAYGENLLVAADGQMRDVLTGEPHGEPLPAGEPVVAAVVHRGRVLAASAERIWEVGTGAEATIAPPWPGDGGLRRLALAEWEGGLAAAVVRRTPAGPDRAELWLPGGRRSALPDGTAVAVLSHDGRLLTAVAGRSGALSVTGASSAYHGGPVRSYGGWARRSGRMLAVLTGEPAMLYDVERGLPYARIALPADPPDGPLEVALDGGGLRVRDSFTGRELLSRAGQHDDATVAVTATATRDTDDDALLATGGADGSVRVWQVSSGAPAGGPWQGHAGPVTAVAVTRRRGKHAVVSADASGHVRMWLVSGPVRHAAHPDEVTAVAGGLLRGRPVVASGGEDGTIRFWDPGTAAEAAGPIHCGPVTGLAFAGDVVVAAAGGSVRHWDPATGEPLGASVPGDGRVASAEMNGLALVAAVAGDRLRVWEAATGAAYAAMPLPGPERLQDLTADGARLLAWTAGEPLPPESGGIDSEQLTLWDVTAGEPILRMLTSDEGGHAAFGRAGGRLVAAHGVDARKNPGEGIWPEETGDIVVRDIATGEPRASFRPEAGFNQQLVLTRAGGRDLVLVAADSAVLTCDATTGGQVAPPVRSATGTFTCVTAIEADGRTYAAAGDAAGTVRIWEITPRS
ncbi:WD40 repeat domain-containing protein [Actinoplanes sp. RD1]|uniref:WD40 repeat domain-containing protein n=1 Tax=Actinoplanes sp. RD1 TaxID=3064538 RepID=UPI0027416FBA|nr:hypothetical protein [Actinoplanes sp. RD1]